MADAVRKMSLRVKLRAVLIFAAGGIRRDSYLREPVLTLLFNWRPAGNCLFPSPARPHGADRGANARGYRTAAIHPTARVL